ncbi:putative Dolichol-phosphate mannosyltransferase [Paratrimastix pyriformis]|uniref:Dolichol-phosphate mannosyltransferase subunit 1 n=1 Tax=Paratrimastix pyriformis TaxID=342808 RepID=A0ABQ8UKS7_9EUKA|nr:putative Dolichol-phosphate mannosyltransferase [Paratrimastix pyriformis]
MVKYSVLLPTYNERENLPLIVYLLNRELTKCQVDFEILIIDDNSPDGTLAVAQKLQTVFGPEKIRIESRPGKLGLGTAYIHGMRFATGDFIIILDADLSHHPEALPQFIGLQRAGNYDVVTGTRYMNGGGVWGWNMKRKLTSRVANYIASATLGQASTDMTGSYRLYKRAVLERILPSMVSKGYVFQMEIIMRAKALGYRIGEVPINFVDRVFGESKFKLSEITGYLRGVWMLFWTDMKKASPLPTATKAQ